MTTQIIPPEEVSIAKIKEIFDGAFMDNALTDDGKLSVVESGIKTFLEVDTARKFIRYMLVFSCKKKTRASDIVEFATEVNKGIIFVKAWTLADGIVFDYWLPYDGGLPPKQVISAYRWLRKTALDGIQAHDRKKLIA